MERVKERVLKDLKENHPRLKSKKCAKPGKKLSANGNKEIATNKIMQLPYGYYFDTAKIKL